MGAKGAVAVLYRDLDTDERQRKVICCGLGQAHSVLCFEFRIECMARCKACAGMFSTNDTPLLSHIVDERV